MAPNGAAPAVTGCWETSSGPGSRFGSTRRARSAVGSAASRRRGRCASGDGVRRGELGWSGRYDVGNDVIAANWLLTTAAHEKNEWQSTRLGHDILHRTSSEGPDSKDRETMAAEPARPSV